MLKNVKNITGIIKLNIKQIINSKKFKRTKIILLFLSKKVKRKVYSQKSLSYILKSALSFSVVITSIGITSIFTKNNAQAVFIDDKPVGIIDDIEITENQLSSNIATKLAKENGVKAEIKEKISLVPIIASNSDISTKYEILNSVANDISYSVDSYTVSVNGEKKVHLKSKSEAYNLLDKIKESKTEKNEEIVSVSFVDDVEVIEEYTDSDNIISYDEAYNILNKNVIEKNIYTVVQGDTIEKISNKTGIPLLEIFELNEGLTEDTILRPDDKITITEETPFLSVKTVLKNSYIEEIPYETEKIENNEEYKTYRKVIKEGSEGEKSVTDEITYINGKESERKTIKETIIKEPSNEKIEVGTLQTPPKKATGTFKMPVNGVLTSGFGSRWGTTHKGIDLGAPAGTPVYAADGGVVTFAGWNSGGFGYLVKISHGNGLETYYAHNSRVAVSTGDRVYQGQIISYVGSTGDSTGNHLHFEVREGGVAHNPLDYLQ